MDVNDDPPTSRETHAVVLSEVISVASLFRREYQGLVELAWGLTGSRETAEDLAQESLFTLHRRATRSQSPEAADDLLRRSNVSVDRCVSGRRCSLLVVGTSSTPDDPSVKATFDSVLQSIEIENQRRLRSRHDVLTG